MKSLINSLFVFAAIVFATSCGKDQPPAPRAVTNQPEAQDYFKKFTVAWNATAPGRAQYAVSQRFKADDKKDVESKVNLFLLGDQTYVLEYWEVKNKSLQGAIIEGKWYANEQKNLVLISGTDSKKVAEATPRDMGDNKGGLVLKLDPGFDLKSKNEKLDVVQPKEGWVLTLAPVATARQLPVPDLKKGLIEEMTRVNNGTDKRETFKD